MQDSTCCSLFDLISIAFVLQLLNSLEKEAMGDEQETHLSVCLVQDRPICKLATANNYLARDFAILALPRFFGNETSQPI